MPHSLLKPGMIVWKGKDARRGYCYYTYDFERLIEAKRSICFADMIPIAEKLGFEVVPHWTMHGQFQGWYGVKGLRYHGPFDDVEDVELSPVVQMIINDSMNNKAMKKLLLTEEEISEY
jgi:hypothetical protein